ncbi:DUF5949 family protein [Streptomyces achromogenes]|uniref:DUF5949 family protein n=1 Tax=Streptomyces achromogenes TaxID=67255 RepID=UPI00367DAAB5
MSRTCDTGPGRVETHRSVVLRVPWRYSGRGHEPTDCARAADTTAVGLGTRRSRPSRAVDLGTLALLAWTAGNEAGDGPQPCLPACSPGDGPDPHPPPRPGSSATPTHLAAPGPDPPASRTGVSARRSPHLRPGSPEHAPDAARPGPRADGEVRRQHPGLFAHTNAAASGYLPAGDRAHEVRATHRAASAGPAPRLP